jgi:hypothetical protein
MSATDSGYVANTSNFAFQVSSSRQISRIGRPAYRPTTGTIAAALMNVLGEYHIYFIS